MKETFDEDRNRGLYRKYEVERADGSSEPGGKHAVCEYFVLDLDHDKFAAEALQAYAEACRHEYPDLADDLSLKAARLLRELGSRKAIQ